MWSILVDASALPYPELFKWARETGRELVDVG
jgi:hypothetical protein